MLWHGVSENKKAGNFARSVLLHPVQRCYKFPIPHHPSSSNLIPFISQTPYIYLTGFQLAAVRIGLAQALPAEVVEVDFAQREKVGLFGQEGGAFRFGGMIIEMDVVPNQPCAAGRGIGQGEGLGQPQQRCGGAHEPQYTPLRARPERGQDENSGVVR